MSNAQEDGWELMWALDLVRRNGYEVRKPLEGDVHADLGLAYEALRRLIALKDGPRDADYEYDKPRAWAFARLVASQCTVCGRGGGVLLVGESGLAHKSCAAAGKAE